ncbi:hypothetical protein PLEOSDRAFT_156533 [Pleurotus ostreatus PC15]|uniref:Alpha/beta hydrolase fold-3 domain-containing protein n=1 Tax=Pleurotus ostreatus (strain PC15) TaxID=1137138 RepID=A0A067NP67_PLEO1|nr:hypothetical protein PLEOSDRAFT_156533 [Pleurotus ostreatus PC15]
MPFAFRHQPFKTLYFFGVALSFLFVKLPFWTVRYLVPAWRPVREWSLSRMLLIKSLGVLFTTMFDTSIDSLKCDPEKEGPPDEVGLVWIEPKQELVVGEIKSAAQVNNIHPIKVAGFWYGKRGENGQVGQAAGPDEKVIYELHGGGFVLGSAGPKGGSAYFCSEALKYAPHYTRVFQVEYRLSQGPPLEPSGAFPAALIDAMLGYDYLVNTVGFKPSNIMIAGESAGGHLALALARYIVHASIPSLTIPGALMLHSPTVDWGNTHRGPKSSMHTHANSDFVHNFLSGYPTRSLVGSLPQSDAYLNAWISPASLRLEHSEGLFAGLPPTLILAGAVEMTLDPMKTLADRMEADMGKDLVTYVEIENATHAVLLAKWHEPERTHAYEVFASWAKKF